MSLTLNLAQSLGGKKCSKVRAARLLYLVTRPIKFVFYDIVFAVDTVSVKALLMSLTRLSFECLSCLLSPIPLVSRNARTQPRSWRNGQNRQQGFALPYWRL